MKGLIRSRPLPRGRGQEGFTLIEAVLALSIAAIVLALVLASLRTGLLSWEKGEKAAERVSAMRFVSMRLTADISSMYLYSQNTDTGAAVLFTAGPSALGFVSLGPAMPGRVGGGARYVSYSVDDEGLVVSERVLPAADPAGLEGGGGMVLALGVKEARFEYLGPDGWADRWVMGGRKRLPSAVRAILDFGGGFRHVVTAQVASAQGE